MTNDSSARLRIEQVLERRFNLLLSNGDECDRGRRALVIQKNNIKQVLAFTSVFQSQKLPHLAIAQTLNFDDLLKTFKFSYPHIK